jgi:hypothetical protein
LKASSDTKIHLAYLANHGQKSKVPSVLLQNGGNARYLLMIPGMLIGRYASLEVFCLARSFTCERKRGRAGHLLPLSLYDCLVLQHGDAFHIQLHPRILT